MTQFIYKVNIEAHKLFDDMQKPFIPWCTENMGEFGKDWYMYFDTKTYLMVLQFKEEKDLLFFKLKWE